MSSPDHLLVEWFAGEKPESKEYKRNRTHSAFRYNILNHLGLTSTLRNSKSTTYPGCWEQLKEPILFKVEAYDPVECDQVDDLWPCKNLLGTFSKPSYITFPPEPGSKAPRKTTMTSVMIGWGKLINGHG